MNQLNDIEQYKDINIGRLNRRVAVSVKQDSEKFPFL